MKRRIEQEDTLLATTVSIERYYSFLEKKDKEGIAKFIRKRFSERYLEPLRGAPKRKRHGFCIMAICCLMIESLESFRQGWTDTFRIGKKAFLLFLSREKEFQEFSEPCEFYTNVRCGILHQGETKGGWRVVRNGRLFDSENLTINATRFMNRMERALCTYCDELKGADWDSKIWRNLRKKMEAVIQNCRQELKT